MLFRFDFWFYAAIVVYKSANCDSGIMIAPKAGTKADLNFRLPKQTTTLYWVGSDI